MRIEKSQLSNVLANFPNWISSPEAANLLLLDSSKEEKTQSQYHTIFPSVISLSQRDTIWVFVAVFFCCCLLCLEQQKRLTQDSENLPIFLPRRFPGAIPGSGREFQFQLIFIWIPPWQERFEIFVLGCFGYCGEIPFILKGLVGFGNE